VSVNYVEFSAVNMK